MSQNELTIKISANINDFNKKLEQIQNRTEDLNDSLNKAGLIAGASFAALTAITFKTVGEFKEANKASILLENSLKNQGIFSERLIGKYKGMASELSKLVNIDDDVIIKGQAVLQRFLGQKEITEELTLQTINLAKAQGMDLESAFALVGKTIAGEMNPLARQLGITIAEGATETEKMAIVTEKLKQKLDGVAEAMAKAEGPTGALAISFGNLQEKLGEKLKPMFDGTANALLKFTQFLEENETAMRALAGVVTTGLALSGLIVVAVGAAKAFLALQAAALALGTTVGVLTGGIGFVAVALGLLVFGLSKAKKELKGYDAVNKQIIETEKELDELRNRRVSSLASEEVYRRNRIRDLEKELPLLKKQLEMEKEKELGEIRNAQQAYENSQKQKALAEKEAAIKEREEERKNRIAAAKELSEQLIDAGKDELKKLEDLRDRRIKIAMGDKNLLLQIEKDFQDKKLKLEEDNNKKLNDLRKAQADYEKKLEEDRLKTMNSYTNNPMQVFGKDFSGLTGANKEAAAMGAGAGVLNQVSAGKAGAKTLVTEGAAMAVDMFAPGVGQALKPLLGALTGGPEAVRSFVQEFTAAVPDLIEGLITAIPVLIEELANAMPVIIERLAEKAPMIIKSLAESMPRAAIALALQMPRVAVAFIKEIPNMMKSFVEELVKGAGKFIQALIEMLGFGGSGGLFGTGIGGGGNGFLGGEWDWGRIGTAVVTGGASEVFNTITDAIGIDFGFAEGGEFAKMVPSGFPNDSFPARLQSGELVVDQRTSSGLREFIKDQRTGGADVNTALLNKILNALERPMEITTTAMVKEKAFADIILNLNRNNARLA